MFKAVLSICLDRIIGWLWTVSNKVKNKKIVGALKDELDIYKALKQLVKEDYVDRVLFVYMHNCGGRIIPGRPKYISVIEQVRSDTNSTKISKHQRQLVDIGYMQAILNAFFSTKKTSKIKVEQIDDGFLKDVYEADSVKESIIAYVASNEDCVWYLAINSKTSIDESNLELIGKIRNCRTSIANVLEEYYKLEDRV